MIDQADPALHTIVLISGDYDFVSALRMAYDKGFRVVLIHSTSLQVLIAFLILDFEIISIFQD